MRNPPIRRAHATALREHYRARFRARVAFAALAAVGAFLGVTVPGTPAAGATAGLPPAGPSEACARGAGAGREPAVAKLAVRHGSARQRVVVLAEGAPDRAPAPVLLALHGYGSSPGRLLRKSGLRAAAAATGVVVVVPSAPGATPHWATPGGLPGGDDVAYLARTLAAVGERWCVDFGHLAVAGFSNGALMTTWLACAWGDRLAGVALVAGANLGPACAPQRVPALLVHGAADPVVRIAGGPVIGGRLQAVPWAAAVARWPGAQVVVAPGVRHDWPDDVTATVLALLR